jgi:hypothetical protein
MIQCSYLTESSSECGGRVQWQRAAQREHSSRVNRLFIEEEFSIVASLLAIYRHLSPATRCHVRSHPRPLRGARVHQRIPLPAARPIVSQRNLFGSPEASNKPAGGGDKGMFGGMGDLMGQMKKAQGISFLSIAAACSPGASKVSNSVFAIGKS